MTEPSEWDLLLENYKLRVAWATAHYDRIMRRLQLFLTLETAAATALIISSNGKLSPAAPWIAGLETLLSFVWFWVGRSDRRMLRIYNYQLKQSWDCLASLAKVSGQTPIGNVETTDKLESLKWSYRTLLVETRSAKDVPLGSALIPFLLLPLWLAATIALIVSESS